MSTRHNNLKCCWYDLFLSWEYHLTLVLHEHSPDNQLSFSHASAINIYTLTSPKDLCQIDFAEYLPKDGHEADQASQNPKC